jgi:hypothetical protein
VIGEVIGGRITEETTGGRITEEMTGGEGKAAMKSGERTAAAVREERNGETTGEMTDEPNERAKGGAMAEEIAAAAAAARVVPRIEGPDAIVAAAGEATARGQSPWRTRLRRWTMQCNECWACSQRSMILMSRALPRAHRNRSLPSEPPSCSALAAGMNLRLKQPTQYKRPGREHFSKATRAPDLPY